MWIVVGLGNPGREYERTRHNAGFLAVEQLAARWRIVLREEGHVARAGSGTGVGIPVRLVEPLQFMNRSGEALAALGIATAEMVVVHDDIDLLPGQLRVRRGGGTGGHRGLESLVQCCGLDFVRVRIGVGRPPSGIDAADYVLTPMTGIEWFEFRTALDRGIDAVECLLAEGLQSAMNRFNVRQKNENIGQDDRTS